MKSILVTGATGKQGGAVVNALLAEDADIEILAVTRNPQSSGAKKLADKSPKIKLVQGDLDNPAGIFKNARQVSSEPIWGVFSVQIPMGQGQTVEKEERQGKALIDEALAQKVQHFVYTSVDRGGDASIDNATNIPHFISKHRIEQHLFERTRAADMSWTVLRPVFFFDNITPDFMGRFVVTAWDAYLQGKPLQCIAVSDIGYFAAQAFLNPAEYRNRCLSLAGDVLTYEHMQETMKRKTGREAPTTFRLICYVAMWMVKEMRVMFEWFYAHGYRADIAKLREMHPGLKDFEKWLEEDSKFVKR
ncbi:nmrA-like family domain-containing protein 1 [Aspergillus udagawae]|nr:nmrA-like family domain-containing protein 1 [Aspergillus udagawae]